MEYQIADITPVRSTLILVNQISSK